MRDTLGRISEIGLTRPGQSRQVVVNQLMYAPFGPATGWSYGNGRHIVRPVDRNYRPERVFDAATGGLSLGFTYDPVGAITALTSGNGSDVLAQYDYDTLGRLTQTKDGPSGTPIETYTYDPTGNRLSLTTAAGTQAYQYPATSHRLIEVDGEARQHDAAGNTLSIGGREYVYNDANRMHQAKQGGAVVESYLYNRRGERVQRAPAGGDAQLTLYDEAGQWLGNYSSSGQALQQAIWLDNYPVALINAPAVGVPEVAYIQPDHLGTPRVVIDPARNVSIWEWSNKSEVFGNQAPNSDPDGDGVAFELALRFPGQQATEASGLNYNYQREYEPAVGRYSQSDPIGLAGGPSSYGYAGYSPVNYFDVLGLCSCGLPAASRFTDLYPDYAEFTGEQTWDLIGGSLNDNYGSKSPGGTQNSCAARVSYGLNYTGEKIPPGTPGANRNWSGDDNRYIISARQMNNYLSSSYGAPTQTLGSATDLQALQESLGPGGAAIVSSEGHVGVVTPYYADPHVSSYLGDVWVMPGGNCSCP